MFHKQIFFIDILCIVLNKLTTSMPSCTHSILILGVQKPKSMSRPIACERDMHLLSTKKRKEGNITLYGLYFSCDANLRYQA